MSKSRLISLVDWMHVASNYFPLVWVGVILYLGYELMLSAQANRDVLTVFKHCSLFISQPATSPFTSSLLH